MQLLEHDSRKLTRQLDRHDALFEKIATRRKELLASWDEARSERDKVDVELAQLHLDMAELKREGLVRGIVRSVKEGLAGHPSAEERLKRQRMEILTRFQAARRKAREVLTSIRTLLIEEERLLYEFYGSKDWVRTAGFAFTTLGLSASAVLYPLGFGDALPFSAGLTGVGAFLLWLTHRARKGDRIIELEHRRWDEIIRLREPYRDRLTQEIADLGLVMEEMSSEPTLPFTADPSVEGSLASSAEGDDLALDGLRAPPEFLDGDSSTDERDTIRSSHRRTRE